MTGHDAQLARLVEAAAAGRDPDAGRKLVSLLHGEITAFVRTNASMRGFRRSTHFEDHVRDVCLLVTEKLCDMDKLRSYLTWQQVNSTKQFRDWLHIITKRSIQDFARKELGAKPAEPSTPSVRALLREFASATGLTGRGVRPPLTDGVLLAQVLAFAEARLPPEQFTVISLELRGHSHTEIDGLLELPAGTAAKRARAAEMRLRRHFREA